MLPPNIAILEAQMLELGAQLNLGSRWFAKRSIEVFDKGSCWLLRMAKGAEKNHWNILCNGTLFDKYGRLLSLPPVKFYNLNDREAGGVTLSRCELIEKIGGHMIGVCCSNQTTFDPTSHSGSIANPWFHSEDDVSTSDGAAAGVLREAKKCIQSQVDFKDRAKHLKYMTMTFQYFDNFLYLIHVRQMTTLYEYDENELDIMAGKLSVRRPTRLPCADGWKTVTEVLKGGGKVYLARDTVTGERINIYPPIRRPKLVATLRWKYLLSYWCANEHRWIIMQFPGAAEKYDVINRVVLGRSIFLKQAASKWSSLNLTAQGMIESLKYSNVPRWSIRIIIKMCKVHHERWDALILDEFRKMTPKKLMSVLSLSD